MPCSSVGSGKAKTAVPWRDRPLQPLQTTADILGVSRAKVYNLAKEGHIELCTLGGRTLATTQSIIRTAENATPYQPSKRTAKATAGRIKRARSAWEA